MAAIGAPGGVAERLEVLLERHAAPRDAGGDGEWRLESPLAVAAGISRRRVSLVENLKSLGNTAGRPDRSHIVRIELTPWCHVHVDLAALGEMSEDTPDTLGAALTQALQEERIQKGK